MKKYMTRPICDWLETAWYPSGCDALPDLLIGRWPEDLGLDFPYHTWVVETPRERKQLIRSLQKPVPLRAGAMDFRRGPDSFVSGASRLSPSSPNYCVYPPALKGWPWLVNALWPAWLTEMAPRMCTRQRYSHEFFETQDAAKEYLRPWVDLIPGAKFIGLKAPTITERPNELC